MYDARATVTVGDLGMDGSGTFYVMVVSGEGEGDYRLAVTDLGDVI